MKTIGILAVQGAFAEHASMLQDLGADTLLLRKASDLEQPIDGLILPGGESTVQGKLLRELHMFEPIRNKILDGLPVMGTCAGMILLARHLDRDETVHLGLMDITVRRNAYGRQLGSFATRSEFAKEGPVDMTFIRAPFITDAGENVDILSTVDGNIVAARQDNMLALSFHPEVSDDLTVHRYFLNMIED